MKKSAFISDLIFTFCAAFIGSVCLLRYLTVSLLLSALTALAFATATTLLLGGYWKGKRAAFLLKKSEEREKDMLLLHLAFLSDGAQSKLFFEALKRHETQNQPPRKVNADNADGATPTEEEPKLILRRNGLIVSPTQTVMARFRFGALHADEITPLIRADSENKTLFCGELTKDAESLLTRLGIAVKKGEQSYLLLKEQNALPAEYLGADSFTQKKKRRAGLWFSKNNSRRFLGGGCLLLLTSLITPFPYYYLVLGGALLLTSIFVRVFGYR